MTTPHQSTPPTAPTPPPHSAAIEAAAADWVTRVDAGLTKEEQQIFQDWLSADPRHADAFDHFTEAWSVFDRVQERGAASLILDRLAERTRRSRARRVRTGIAAGFALIAGLVYLQWPGVATTPAERKLAPMLQLNAPVAANERMRKLPDGSIAELNAGAVISVQYSKESRLVKLVSGEAYFRVEKDSSRPFYVEANGVVVRAVGTAFAVQVRPSAVEVVVKEGSVDVGRGSAANNDQGKAVRVGANQRVVFALLIKPAKRNPVAGPAVGSAAVPVPTPAAEAAPAVEDGAAPAIASVAAPAIAPEELSDDELRSRLAWRIPQIEFEGMPLSEAVAVLNRHNRLQLRIEGVRLGRYRVGGTFRSDNPEGFVRMLVETEPDIVAESRGDTEIVLRPAR